MKLEILGSGCANCQKLMAVTQEAVRDLGIDDAELVKVEDFKTIMGYGVMSTPALVIDGNVVLSGKVPSKAEVSSLVTTALAAPGMSVSESASPKSRGASERLVAAHRHGGDHRGARDPRRRRRRAAIVGRRFVCDVDQTSGAQDRPPRSVESAATKAKVTFVELGSTTCMPLQGDATGDGRCRERPSAIRSR